MKSKWIRRDGNKMLILFFGGFACDEKILSRSCVPADCDMVMFFDYRSLDFDFDFSAYAEVSVVAWSFGVWVADFLAKKIGRTFMRVAINGSPFPVDDSLGIPVSIFEKTLSAFDERSKERFLRRVCGGSGEYSELEGLMTSRSASELRDELLFLKGAFAREKFEKKPWDTVIVARNDKIFPLENLKRVWGESAQVGEGEHLNVPIFGMAFAAVSQRVLRTRGGFDKTAETYSENAFVQRDIAATLADVLEDFAPMGDSVSNILEVGCGTGLLTYRLASRFGAAQWYLNDLSEKMCACAARALVKKPNICKGDIMLAEFDSAMDLIVSSSCFQWVPDLRSLFAKLSLVSSGNSLLAFSTFGKKNYAQIRSLTGSGLDYRSLGEIKSALSDAGYCVLYSAEDVVDVSFCTPSEVLKHIKGTGVNGKFTRFWTPKTLRDFSKAYAEKFSIPDGVSLTYNPIYIIAEKK